jgi:hypothetical protein
MLLVDFGGDWRRFDGVLRVFSVGFGGDWPRFEVVWGIWSVGFLKKMSCGWISRRRFGRQKRVSGWCFQKNGRWCGGGVECVLGCFGGI